MAAKLSVVIVALEHDNGTRVSIDGYELDEDVVEFSVGDNILSLKQYIINEKIKNTRDRSQIRVYTPPPTASALTDDNGRWVPCKPLDKLVDEKQYGYIDLGSRLEEPIDKKQKLEADKPDFEVNNYDFVKIVNSAINNKDDLELYERDDIQADVLNNIYADKSSRKPNAVTLWSGRGSGKTSLLRRIALTSEELKRHRECGRLMIIDCTLIANADILGVLRSSGKNVSKLITVLVAYHLCHVFGDSKVEGINFVSNPKFRNFWDLDAEILPPLLLKKLRLLIKQDPIDAYHWWDKCTEAAFANQGEPYKYVFPIILLDTAEELCKFVEEERRCNENGSPIIEPEEKAEGYGFSKGKAEGDGLKTPPTGTYSSPGSISPRAHRHKDRYTVFEWLMKRVPIDRTVIAFGTGAIRGCPRPQEYQTSVNHRPRKPLNAMSENSVEKLYIRHARGGRDGAFSDAEKQELRLAVAVTAGVPRMLVAAFCSEENKFSLPSSKIETWEKTLKDYYSDSSSILEEIGGEEATSSLAKAILTCAVFDFVMQPDERKKICASYTLTWNDLHRLSIVFRSETSGYLRIPRILWGQNPTTHDALNKWVQQACNFELDDILPTPSQLYKQAGEASPTASGRPWEKMFASALVARFFVLCWEADVDPKGHYISLKELLPQKENSADETLDTVEVCLANGVVVNTVSEVFAYASNDFNQTGFDWTAIHANWDHTSAHHDMILPVRNSETKEQQLWAVSARNGHHKTTKELAGTKQHLVSKKEKDKTKQVAGLIQAVNPRVAPKKSILNGVFKEMKNQKRYAEVSIKEGHSHYVLCCFP